MGGLGGRRPSKASGVGGGGSSGGDSSLLSRGGRGGGGRALKEGVSGSSSLSLSTGRIPMEGQESE